MVVKYLKEPQSEDQSVFVFLWSSFLFCSSVWTNSLEEVAYESVKLFFRGNPLFRIKSKIISLPPLRHYF
jgi:hypothetical protein